LTNTFGKEVLTPSSGHESIRPGSRFSRTAEAHTSYTVRGPRRPQSDDPNNT